MNHLHLNSCSIQDIISIIDGAFGKGLSLSDFMFDPKFSDSFNSVILPMSHNNVAVCPGHELAYTKSINSGRNFLIKLKAAMEAYHGCQNNIINATIYKAMLIHELSHIVEGSFEPLNLKSVFKKLGNENLISTFFGYCVEDIRIFNNILKRFPFRTDFRNCLKCYDFIFTGIKGHYCGEFIVDFINVMERQLKCGKTHMEIMKINPQKFFAINEYYKNMEELNHDEEKFFSTPISKPLQNKGIKTVEDLICYMSRHILVVGDCTIIDGIKILHECVELLNGQDKECWNVFNNENPEFSKEKPIHDFFQGAVEPDSMESLCKHGDSLFKKIPGSSEKSAYNDIPSGIPMDESPGYSPLLEYDNENRLCVPVKVDLVTLDRGDVNLMDRVVSAYPSIVGAITEQLRDLQLNHLQIKRMQRIPQSFNPVGVVYASIDNNFARQQKFYDASFRNTMDYAIYYLIDASGSTGAAILPFVKSVIDPDRNSIVLDVEKIAAAVLYSAVQHLDMPESFRQRLFLFQSHNETKIFESLDVSSLSLAEPNFANRDGAAIRTITKELLNESNKTKVIFMFADGMPSDVGYSNGLFDSAMAIKESVDKGIKFFYLLTRNRKTMSLEESHNFSTLTSFVTDKAVVYDPAQLPYRTRDLFSMHLL